MKNRFDIFISYSTNDREFVDRLCSNLESNNVVYWLDRNEILPGDYLRDKINNGLDNTEFILAILSDNSIGSEWVRREIDAAMIREIENKRVTLIPVLLGNVKITQIPPDIRGKNYLDFRDNTNYSKELARLLKRLQISKKKRAAFLKYLRNECGLENNGLEKLTEASTVYLDQTIQKAALGGLANTKTLAGLFHIAERRKRYWGVGAIRYSIELLEKNWDRGGDLILASTCFWDDRFFNWIFDDLFKEIQDKDSAIQFLQSNSYEGMIAEKYKYRCLYRYSSNEKKAALYLATQHCRNWHRDKKYWWPKFDPVIHKNSQEIVDSFLPGLSDFLNVNFPIVQPNI